jgi:hypothetical protein
MNMRCTIIGLTVMALLPVCALSGERGRTLDDLLREKPPSGSDREAQLFYVMFSEGAEVQHYMAFHPEPGSRVTPQPKGDGPLLAITWFQGPPTGRLRYGLLYKVSQKGEWYNVREVYQWATQADHRGQLSDKNLADLRELLPKLPKSTAKPPIERTVVITFEQDGKWRREVYDSADLPETFEKVMLIVGERFETKDRKHKSR